LTQSQHEAIIFGVADLPRRDCLKPSTMLKTPWLLPRSRQVAVG
jgi:hypothetical protein